LKVQIYDLPSIEWAYPFARAAVARVGHPSCGLHAVTGS
jgi:hypothetical protein